MMAVMAENSSHSYNQYIVVLDQVHTQFYFIIVLQTQRDVHYQKTLIKTFSVYWGFNSELFFKIFIYKCCNILSTCKLIIHALKPTSCPKYPQHISTHVLKRFCFLHIRKNGLVNTIEMNIIARQS